jgi:hypothetical protein
MEGKGSAVWWKTTLRPETSKWPYRLSDVRLAADVEEWEEAVDVLRSNGSVVLLSDRGGGRPSFSRSSISLDMVRLSVLARFWLRWILMMRSEPMLPANLVMLLMTRPKKMMPTSSKMKRKPRPLTFLGARSPKPMVRTDY